MKRQPDQTPNPASEVSTKRDPFKVSKAGRTPPKQIRRDPSIGQAKEVLQTMAEGLQVRHHRKVMKAILELKVYQCIKLEQRVKTPPPKPAKPAKKKDTILPSIKPNEVVAPPPHSA